MRVGVAPRRHSHSQHSRLDGKGDENDSQRRLIGCRARDIFLDSQTHDPLIQIRSGFAAVRTRTEKAAGVASIPSVLIFLSACAPCQTSSCLGCGDEIRVHQSSDRRVRIRARAPRVDSNLTPACFERRPLFLHRSARRARCGLDTTVNVTVARVLGSRRRPRCCWRRSRWRRRSRSLPRRLG